VVLIPQQMVEDEAARIARAAAIVARLDAEMAKDVARERRLAGQRMKAAAAQQRRWERVKRREGARVMPEFERISREELPALLDATEAYRLNDDDPVLQPKECDGVVLPLDILATLLACCTAPEPDRSRPLCLGRVLDRDRARARWQCRGLLPRSPGQPAAAAGTAGDDAVGLRGGAGDRLSAAIIAAQCSA